MQQKGYLAQWQNEMRLYGTHPDTVKMFLDAPERLPLNDVTGAPLLGGTAKRFNADSTRGFLWLVVQSADIRRSEKGQEDKTYQSYVIKPVLVFDLNPPQKK
jgi:hypothetical protein